MTTITDDVGALLAQLQSSDFYEREEAVRRLASCSGDEAVAGLVLAIEDPDLGIRELAADYLSQVDGDLGARLLVRFLGHQDIGTRNLAAEILVKIGPDAVQPLLDEIENEDHDVRKFIVDVLGLIKDERAVTALCGRLSDGSVNVVCSASEALGEIGCERAVGPLITVFHRYEDARMPTVEALGKIGDETALEHLGQFLNTDDPMIRFAVVEAIGNIGSLDSVPQLLPYLDETDGVLAEVAMTAIISISYLNNGRLDHKLPLDRFTEFLFNGVRSGSRKITEFTLSRLENWHDSNVIANLLAVLDRFSEGDRVRLAEIFEAVGSDANEVIIVCFPTMKTEAKLILLELLQQFADAEMGRQLVSLLSDPNPVVKQRLAQVIGLTGATAAIPDLMVLAKDSNGHVRRAAFLALGWLCDERDIDFLITGLDDIYPDVREAAMGAVIVVSGEQVIGRFTQDLQHQSVEHQRLAATALGLIGTEQVIGPLTDAVGNPDPGIRQQALNALARIGGIEDTGRFVAALGDENAAVRKAAVSALVATKRSEAVNDIRFLLDDADLWVRFHVITVIGELGAKENANCILPLLDDDNDVVKIAAIKALAQMRCREAIPSLDPLRNDKNLDVVEAAVSAVSDLEAGQ